MSDLDSRPSRSTSKRQPKATASSKFAKFRELKQSGGRSRISQYNNDEDAHHAADDNDIYDEVDEEHYQAIVKGRLKEEEFVIDDDGRGYVDNGLEEWDNSEGEDGSEDEEDEEEEARRNKKGKRKRTKQEKAEVEKLKVKPEHQIKSFFQRGAQSTLNATSKKPSAPTEQEEELMQNIFDDLDADVQPTPKKPKKSFNAAATSSSRARYMPVKIEPVEQPFAIPEASPVFDVNDDGEDFLTSDMMPDEPPEPTTMDPSSSSSSTGTAAAVAAASKTEANASSPPSAPVKIEPQPPRIVVPALKVRDIHRGSTATNQPTVSRLRPAIPEKPKPRKVPESQTTALPAISQSTWASAGMMSDETTTPAPPAPLAGTGSTAVSEHVFEEDGNLRMYWIDAVDKNGTVFLFGKVLNRSTNLYVSCCVCVNNIERNVFVLPRTVRVDAQGKDTDSSVSMLDVYQEFDSIRQKHRIPQWASKEVSRNYAFEMPGVPTTSDYLKVVYSYAHPQLPNDLSGETFSRIFGANTTALEHFLLKRNLMGPGWLEIKNVQPSSVNISWAKLEVTVDDPKFVKRVLDTSGTTMTKKSPPLNIVSINIRTMMNSAKKNEIILASVLVYENVLIDNPAEFRTLPCQRYTVVRQLSDRPLPSGFHDLANQRKFRVEVVRTERALLNYLIAQLTRCDPDVIVGHNFVGFDLNILLDRMKEMKVDGWSRLGRLRRTVWPKLGGGGGGNGDTTYAMKAVVAGRLMCDTYLQAKDLIVSKSYKLGELALSQLQLPRDEIDYDQLILYYNTANDLLNLAAHCSHDAFLSLGLAWKLQALPLTKELTTLAGNLWSKTLLTGRAERNEVLLLHEFHKLKFLCPDKLMFGAKTTAVAGKGLDAGDEKEEEKSGQAKKASTSSRRKPAYAGGLVLEPKKGLYDKFVLLLDFLSLYPSIIQEFNICFTTVKRGTDCLAEDEIPDVPGSSRDPGVLPKLLKSLVERRRNVKALMKHRDTTPTELAHYDIVQKALKLTANSMYGCLGFTHSRFYAKPLAMLITSKGREILQNTVDLAEKQRLEVIYGDTDSIMIHTHSTDLDEVKRIGDEFRREVNKRYKLLEIETDGVFQRMLLLKKKKYAALVVVEKDGRIETRSEVKGIDMVRRDWCQCSKDASNFVLTKILSGQDRDEVLQEIHTYLENFAKEMREKTIPLEKYIITKSLTKAPEHYADKSSQPHVTVALRMRAKGLNVQVGETIPYVICKEVVDKEGKADGPMSAPTLSFAARAYHPDELRKDLKFEIDVEWYLNQQIHPPVARLLDPIEGTDAARVADCLGLDPAKFRSPSQSNRPVDEISTLSSQMTDAERFKDVTRFVPKCRRCGETSEMESVVARRPLLPFPSPPPPPLQKSDDGDHHEEKKVKTDTAAAAKHLVSALECPNRDPAGSKHQRPTASLEYQLLTAIRSHVRKFQDGWLVCDDQGCTGRTRSMSVYGRRCLQANCRGSMVYEYSDGALYTQLLYYESLFDVDRAIARSEGTPDAHNIFGLASTRRESFEPLRQIVRNYLEQCARRYVNLGELFSFCNV